MTETPAPQPAKKKIGTAEMWDAVEQEAAREAVSVEVLGLGDKYRARAAALHQAVLLIELVRQHEEEFRLLVILSRMIGTEKVRALLLSRLPKKGTAA